MIDHLVVLCRSQAKPCLVALAAWLVCASCGPRDTDIEPEIRYISPDTDTSSLDDICATSAGYNREECRPTTFLYEVVRNERVDREDTTNARSGTYSILWSKTGTQYFWKVRFVPEDGHTSRQVRFIVNEEELPHVVTLRSQNNLSSQASFDVDLRPDDGKLCPHEINKDCEDDTKISTASWLKRYKEGEIEVEIQDVSFCYLQNRKNRDVRSNQVDCNNATESSSYFRSQILNIPYILNFDGQISHLLCEFARSTDDTLGRGNWYIGPIVRLISGAVGYSRCLDPDDHSNRNSRRHND